MTPAAKATWHVEPTNINPPPPFRFQRVLIGIAPADQRVCNYGADVAVSARRNSDLPCPQILLARRALGGVPEAHAGRHGLCQADAGMQGRCRCNATSPRRL